MTRSKRNTLTVGSDTAISNHTSASTSTSTSTFMHGVPEHSRSLLGEAMLNIAAALKPTPTASPLKVHVKLENEEMSVERN